MEKWKNFRKNGRYFCFPSLKLLRGTSGSCCLSGPSVQVGGRPDIRSTHGKTAGKMAVISAFCHLNSYDTARYTRIVLSVESFRQVGDTVQT
jgi:hypothetical protein